MNPHYQQQLYLRPPLIAFFNFSHKRPTFAFTSESGYTLAFRRRISHNGSHGETRGVLGGGAITTLGAFRAFRKPCVAGCQNGELCRFCVLAGGALKERGEPRNSDALMRVVPRRRGPAGLRDPVVRPLMLRFSVSVRKVSAQSPVNAMRSSSHLNQSTTQPSSKNRTQRPTRRNVCALDMAILGGSCYTDGHRKPLKKFFNFFENRVRNGVARTSI